MCNLDDRETAAQISENMYMQYFLGYSSFSSRPLFDASLFVEFRHRLGSEVINEMNEKIVAMSKNTEHSKHAQDTPPDPDNKG
jgi:transposase, IS5 family